ncbi:hypothetical protein LUZ60_000802 [Juncus effusus]|nr:hypothetical protein LUZ60_000802 [Juncus effusus]
MGHRTAAVQNQRLNPAVDDLMTVLSEASSNLSAVQDHLLAEFQRSYPDRVNPCKLVARIKKIQAELVSLKELCRELLSEKQELIDKARASLVAQRNPIQKLLASSGLPLMNESDEATYTNLDQIIAEWSATVRTKKEDGDSEDINKMLFSAIVQND